MSFLIVDWAAKQSISAAAKHTLVMICTFINNESLQCNPSLASIAKRTRYNESAVKKHIKLLKEKGYLSIKSNFSKSGGKTSNQYNFPASAHTHKTIIQEYDENMVAVGNSSKKPNNSSIDTGPHSFKEAINKESLEQVKEPTYESDDSTECFEIPDDEKPKASAEKQIPYEEIIAAYHHHLPNLVRNLKLTPKIKSAINARWREDKRHRSVGFWENYFDLVNMFPWYANPTKEGWRCDLSHLISASGFNKMIERIEDKCQRD